MGGLCFTVQMQLTWLGILNHMQPGHPLVMNWKPDQNRVKSKLPLAVMQLIIQSGMGFSITGEGLNIKKKSFLLNASATTVIF